MTNVQTPSRQRKNPAPWILGAAILALVVYYIVIGVSGILLPSASMKLTGLKEPTGSNYVTLQLRVQDVDLTQRTVTATLQPIAHGNLVGPRSGEIAEPLRIEVSSGGVTSTVVTYPGQSIVDPTSVSFPIDRGDSAYPFDMPFASFQLTVKSDESQRDVPFALEMENSARPWMLTATAETPVEESGNTIYPVLLEGSRDALSITLVSFYVLAILITTLMAVVTIGSAILRKKLEFANVIWLSATMLSFPALRSAMPGAPPIGTAMDFLVLFPCICLIAVMLVWTGGYLLWRESSVLRKRTLDDENPATSTADFSVEE